MCGIAGIVYRDRERPVSEGLVRRMCDALRPRGPDDEGLYVRGNVGLGMRRLSIIDLSGGRQPIFNEDRSKTIVFNGEIYNYQELRRSLVAGGHVLRSHGDTETVLHLYEDLGPDCVTKLRGMFAFAIWDSSTETLLLARDRLGIKPLYVAAAPWGIAFASELKALVAAHLTSGELDWQALDAYLQLGYVPAPASPFLDIRKLEPGHWLRWRPTGELTIRQYWDLPPATVPAPPDVERRVLEWIDASVTAHLVSDVPVAAFLSGGLDSSAVVASMAAVAARHGGEVPHAFTARYHGSGAEPADETGLARRLADRYGVRLSIVDITPDIRDVVEPMVHALDEPHADDSAIPTWALSQIVGGSYKVALAGIGGDELFAGYRRHAGLLAAERYGRVPRALRAAAAALGEWLPDTAGSDLTVDRVKRFLRAGTGAPRATPDRYLDLQSRAGDLLRDQLYTPALRDAVAGNAARERFRRVHRRGGQEGLAAALYLDYKTYLADDILALSDRLSMAHSLEIRVPLVDHVLIENVFPLPARLKIDRWKLKALLKRALRGRLPDAHFQAPKRGFVGPTAAWLRGELRGMALDELSAARMTRLGHFNPKVVARLVDEHFTQRHNREGILWALLCYSTWHRLFVEGTAPAAAGVSERPVGAVGSAGSRPTWGA
ncbi:MAG TPA: asparagine synthase (glutamine-hydrolyzing) [Gemmatimonadales bacterium]|jgi:asparagine synthase (glutamine-hydrolysing)